MNKCKNCIELNKVIEEKEKCIKKLKEEIKLKEQIKHKRLNSTDISSFNSNKRYDQLEDSNYQENNSINNDKMNEIRNLLKKSKDEIEIALNNKININNKGNVYNFFQCNNNFFFNQNSINSMKNNKVNENNFKRGNK